MPNVPPSPERRHRVNEQIRISQIRVIADNGDQLGIITPQEALQIAREKNLDLVEVAPDARPPVCKIMDYGKFLYQEAKRTKSKPAGEVKTITLRPKTGDHDLETKLKQAREFIHRGDKVRFQMRMRGRENARPEMWIRLLDGIIARLTDVGTITQTPRVDGKGITAQVDPGATKGRAVLKPTVPETPEPRPPSGPQVTTTRRMERPSEGAAPPAVDPARRPPPPSGAPAPARGPGPR